MVNNKSKEYALTWNSRLKSAGSQQDRYQSSSGPYHTGYHCRLRFFSATQCTTYTNARQWSALPFCRMTKTFALGYILKKGGGIFQIALYIQDFSPFCLHFWIHCFNFLKLGSGGGLYSVSASCFQWVHISLVLLVNGQQHDYLNASYDASERYR